VVIGFTLNINQLGVVAGVLKGVRFLQVVYNRIFRLQNQNQKAVKNYTCCVRCLVARESLLIIKQLSVAPYIQVCINDR
jgi:hypothetical protein